MKDIGDMYLAAAFLSYGGVLEKVDHSNPRHKVFSFTTDGIKRIWVMEDEVVREIVDPNPDDLVVAFSNDELMLPPDYHFSIRTIKAAIHNRL